MPLLTGKGIFLNDDMAIIYSLNKIKDIYNLEVEQTTTYSLYYNNIVIETKEIFPDFISTPKFTVDGVYTLVLQAEGEQSIEIEVNIYNNLVLSIINDALGWLCNCGCNTSKNCKGCNNCISKDAKKALNHRITLNKLIIYQSYYLPTYLENKEVVFNTFIKKTIKDNNCITQNTTNRFLLEECLEGKIASSDKIFRLHLATYWLAIFNLEFELVDQDQEEREYVMDKFKYNLIKECICDLCLDIKEIDPVDDVVIPPVVLAKIYQWQFENDLITDIDVAPAINQVYLESKALLNTNQAENGINVQFNFRGRISFAVQGKGEDYYGIYDQFNQDITSIVFDKYYNEDLDVDIYISKEFYSPSTIYFKFIEN